MIGADVHKDALSTLPEILPDFFALPALERIEL